jgi:TonB-linked outer membrane protein, SusC/RagA family/TonB-dependent outer membrane receptor, SusC/RagA subfamily, signature region
MLSKKNIMVNGRALLLMATLSAFCMPLNAVADNSASNPSSSIDAMAQDGRTVKVVVTDKAGPLAGATVFLKGTKTGDITDMKGVVTLSNVPSNATLVVSYIGYQTQEILSGDMSTITVTLAEDSEALKEVVVVGYGTMEKKQVTSAVTSISAKDMMVGVSGADITTALQGKVSGLVMKNVGSANSGTSIQLRGMTSINAGKSPLIVIDGFPGGDIRSLTQEDIKSIDILKDASAGAIYGTRAASGVILITTKSGSDTNGKIRLTYSNEFSKKQDYNAPEMLSGREYAEHKIGTDYGSDVNWWNELINKDNFSQKHHIALDMGTENAQVYTSFFYEKNQGIAINDERQDYGGRINSTFKLFKGWLEVRPSVDYRQAKRNNNYPNFQQALRNNPTRSPYDETSETGYNVWTSESLDYNVVADSRLSDYYGLDKWFKPEVNFKLNIKPVPGLSFQQTIGYENRQWENHTYNSRYHRDEIENSRNGSAYLGFSKTENLTSEGFATYVKEFEGGHSLNAVAGYSFFERNGESFSMQNYDFSVDGIKYWDIGKGSYLSDGKASMSSGKDITERLFSLFARVSYSYKDKYLFQASVRREGSSKFAADNRWATFWAVSGGWRISNESFMEHVGWVDDLKLRFGYGVTGNNDFSASYMANMLGSDTYWMLPSGEWAYSYGKTQNVNPNLGWEEKKEWNVGLDYALFNNRLYGKFDVYRRKIDNMIYSVKVPQPPYTQGSQWQNIGSLESKGWEFEIGGDIIRSKDVTWTSDINLSHNSGKILTLWGNNTYYNGNGFVAPGSPGDAARMEEGSSIGSFFLWKFAGFDDDGKFLLYNKDGEVIPADQKTEKDKQYMGDYVPEVIVGWSNTVAYRNLDFGITMRSWIDFDVYNTINMYYGIQNMGNTNVLKDAYGKFSHIKGEKQICDYYLEDGTFLKIDAITLGYTLPLAKRTNNIIERIRIYGTVGNVCTITGYSGMNPEVDITGWDGGTERFWSGFYPNVRTYTLGMQFNF